MQKGLTLTARGQRRLGGVAFEVLDQGGAVACIHTAVQQRAARAFAFCNMHTFNIAQRSPAFRAALAQCTVFNDGIGLDIASRILHGAPFAANLNGTDLTPAVLGAADRPLRLYLVGGQPGVAQQAAGALAARYPLLTIAGCDSGFFTPAQNAALIERIRASGADLVLAGMGNPRQELWAVDAAPRTGAVILCVGAFLDFAAGRVPRAPRWVRAARCEWAWRLAIEPRRLAGRYLLGGAAFARTILAHRLGVHAPHARAGVP